MSKRRNNRGGNTAANEKPNVIGIIAVLALVVAVVYVITSLALGIRAGAPVWNPLNWGKAGTSQSEPSDAGSDDGARTIAVSADGNAIKDGGAYALGRSAVNGITYLSETQGNQTYVPDGEIIVTAELSNEYINGAFDWTVEFANPSAEWAGGKVAAYYVSVEPVEGNSASARLRYLAPFGEQIILTATLRGTNSSDSCTIDCLKEIVTTGSLGYGGDWGDCANFAVKSNVEYSLGTVSGNFEFVRAAITFDESFIRNVNSHLKFTINIGTHTFFASDVLYEYSDCVDCDIDMSMFIEGFDDYDQAHKEAIYYAWYTAYRYDGKMDNFFCVDIEFNYTYNGIKVSGLSESDIPARDLYCDEGAYIEPNTQLNKNYTF